MKDATREVIKGLLTPIPELNEIKAGVLRPGGGGDEISTRIGDRIRQRHLIRKRLKRLIN